jgi:serine/threonine protein kinase
MTMCSQAGKGLYLHEEDTIIDYNAWKEFSSKMVIANGSYGKVVKADWLEFGQKVAIKEVSYKSQVLNEIQLLYKLNKINDQNVSPKFYGCQFTVETTAAYPGIKAKSYIDKVYIVQELLHKDLFSLTGQSVISTWSLEEVIKRFRNVVKGIHYIHETGFSHKDIKPANLMLGFDQRTIYLIDFGEIQKFSDVMIHRGTPYFMSTNAQNGKKNLPKDDLYAFALSVASIFGSNDELFYDYKYKCSDEKGKKKTCYKILNSACFQDKLTQKCKDRIFENAKDIFEASDFGKYLSFRPVDPSSWNFTTLLLSMIEFDNFSLSAYEVYYVMKNILDGLALKRKEMQKPLVFDSAIPNRNELKNIMNSKNYKNKKTEVQPFSKITPSYGGIKHQNVRENAGVRDNNKEQAKEKVGLPILKKDTPLPSPSNNYGINPSKLEQNKIAQKDQQYEHPVLKKDLPKAVENAYNKGKKILANADMKLAKDNDKVNINFEDLEKKEISEPQISKVVENLLKNLGSNSDAARDQNMDQFDRVKKISRIEKKMDNITPKRGEYFDASQQKEFEKLHKAVEDFERGFILQSQVFKNDPHLMESQMIGGDNNDANIAELTEENLEEIAKMNNNVKNKPVIEIPNDSNPKINYRYFDGSKVPPLVKIEQADQKFENLPPLVSINNLIKNDQAPEISLIARKNMEELKRNTDDLAQMIEEKKRQHDEIFKKWREPVKNGQERKVGGYPAGEISESNPRNEKVFPQPRFKKQKEQIPDENAPLILNNVVNERNKNEGRNFRIIDSKFGQKEQPSSKLTNQKLTEKNFQIPKDYQNLI